MDSEGALVRRLGELFKSSFQSGVKVGIGDDAAVFSGTDSDFIATVDMAVEGIHFNRDWSTPFQIGAKLTTASLADVFAMGGEPDYLLVATGINQNEKTQVITEIAEGIRSVADKFKVSVIGGDLSKSEKLVLSITAIGQINSEPIKRNGAKVGDIVYVSALPGLSAAGLAILKRGLDRPRYVVEAHLNPKLVRPDSLIKVASAMCDISDGLCIDAGHIASASGVSINLSSELISKADNFKDLAELSTEIGEETFDWILNGGEDHFFIATVDPKYRGNDLGIEIGIVGAGNGEVRLDGKEIEIKGYQHF